MSVGNPGCRKTVGVFLYPNHNLKNQTDMTPSKFVPVLGIILCSACFVGAYVSRQDTAKTTATETEKTPEKQHIFDGVEFDVKNVIETFGYEDEAYYMTYDDVDAGLCYEVIRISKKTHDRILKTQDLKQNLTGTLKATKPYESVEYELEADEFIKLYQYPQMTIE